MPDSVPFTDIHCHIVPGLDDGARDEAESLVMAAAAVRDGTTTVIATPHQLGGNARVTAADIRRGVAAVNAALERAGIPLDILAGADVRIEPELPALLRRGDVVTLGDHGRHVLLELPHDAYVPLGPLLQALRKQGLTGILSHPERNKAMQARPDTVADVVRDGGLIQITAGSLTGGFGNSARLLADTCVRRRLVHFVASDAHDTSRRPFGLAAAHAAVTKLADRAFADAVTRENPARVAAGEPLGSRGGGGRRTGSGWLSGRVA